MHAHTYTHARTQLYKSTIRRDLYVTVHPLVSRTSPIQTENFELFFPKFLP